MDHVELKSSMLKSVAFDPVSGELEVIFPNGSKYRYEGVPEWQYRRILKAKSAASEFHRQVRKGPYRARKVE